MNTWQELARVKEQALWMCGIDYQPEPLNLETLNPRDRW